MVSIPEGWEGWYDHIAPVHPGGGMIWSYHPAITMETRTSGIYVHISNISVLINVPPYWQNALKAYVMPSSTGCAPHPQCMGSKANGNIPAFISSLSLGGYGICIISFPDSTLYEERGLVTFEQHLGSCKLNNSFHTSRSDCSTTILHPVA